MAQLYGNTPFQRHLSFFDQNNDGVLRPSQTLRSALSLGLNFPIACIYTARLHWRYGNLGFLGLSGVSIREIPRRKERSQLQNATLRKLAPGEESEWYTRANLMRLAYGQSVVGKLRIAGFWMMAANRDGLVSRSDVELFQKGELLPSLQERRKIGRENKIPFKRGGPLMYVELSKKIREA